MILRSSKEGKVDLILQYYYFLEIRLHALSTSKFYNDNKIKTILDDKGVSEFLWVLYIFSSEWNKYKYEICRKNL